MSEDWRRLEEHLKDASLYEDASARPAGVSWRRRVLSRHAATPVLPDGGDRIRNWLPAMLGAAGALTVLSLLWYYGVLDGALARLNPSEMEVGRRRPGEWLQLAAGLLELEMPELTLKHYLALVGMSLGLTAFIRRRSFDFLPTDW